MRRDSRGECRARTDTLDDPGYVGRTIQLIHLLGYRHVLVHNGVVVGDHIFVFVVLGSFEGVGLSAEEMAPDGRGDELKQRQDPGRALRGPGWFAVQQEIEEAETEGVALVI